MAALVDWCSLAFFFGSCVSYLVIIGDTFMTFSAPLGDSSFWHALGEGPVLHFSPVSLLMLAIFTAVCLAPLSTLRSMDSLAITSGIAMVCILYAVAVVVVAHASKPGFALLFELQRLHLRLQAKHFGGQVLHILL